MAGVGRAGARNVRAERVFTIILHRELAMRTKPFSRNESLKSDRAIDAEIARLLGAPPPNGGNGRRRKTRSSPNRGNGAAARAEVSTDLENQLRCGDCATPPVVAECTSIQPTSLNAGAFSYPNGGNGSWTMFVTPGIVGQGDAGPVIVIDVACCGIAPRLSERAGDRHVTAAAPLTPCAAPTEPLTACAAQTNHAAAEPSPSCAAPTNHDASAGAPVRDARGRFVKGNKGGPGNPFNRRLAAMRKALCKSVTADDIRALTATMLARARDGDMAATKLLLLYVIGRPTEVVNPDTLDRDEWSLVQQSAEPKDMYELVNRVPHWLLCELNRAISPALTDGRIRQMQEVFRQDVPKETAKADRKAAKRGR